MSTVVSNPSVTTSPMVQFLGEDVQIGGAAGSVGFFGVTPVARQAVAVAATDAATTQALANSLRTALINLGLAI